jgi:hypothetical protein
VRYADRPRCPRIFGGARLQRQAAGTICLLTMVRVTIDAASPSRAFDVANRLRVFLLLRLEFKCVGSAGAETDPALEKEKSSV